MLLRRLLDAPSTWTALDRVAAPVRDVVQAAPEGLRRVLHGAWLGHALHPVPAQLAVGCYTSAALVDAFARTLPRAARPGARAASTMLLATGTAAALPSAASGLTDWAELHEDQQRTGLVHAALTTAATASALVAVVRRLRHPLRGSDGADAASFATLVLSGLGAAVGGHLAYRWAAGVNHVEDVTHTGPEDWVDLGASADFVERRPTRARAGGVDAVVLRVAGRLHAMADRCSHLAAPLSDGEVVERDGQVCLVCPWHGSTFTTDGEPVAGPATAPQPLFHVEEHDGRVRARVVTLPGVAAS
ncbi:Rieske (2Fe-2S) protein [Aquipuribacter sp. SD81]|uniref:Rieske (2Fe-2S) protein n=1 Tax=Aquipuribacter sp. SD81 TaxID=3127703 RepID=UPI0030179ED1